MGLLDRLLAPLRRLVGSGDDEDTADGSADVDAAGDVTAPADADADVGVELDQSEPPGGSQTPASAIDSDEATPPDVEEATGLGSTDRAEREEPSTDSTPEDGPAGTDTDTDGFSGGLDPDGVKRTRVGAAEPDPTDAADVEEPRSDGTDGTDDTDDTDGTDGADESAASPTADEGLDPTKVREARARDDSDDAVSRLRDLKGERPTGPADEDDASESDGDDEAAAGDDPDT
jgi:hypothetical protein